MLIRVFLSVCFSIFFYSNLNAQVAIGHANPEAMLDVKSANSGVLFPRISLSRTDVSAPVISPSDSEMVFNNADTTLDLSIPEFYRVTPGFYYWSELKDLWIRVADDISVPGYNKTFLQTSELQLTNLNQYYDVPGLENMSFVAPYDGVYQVVFTGAYGVGEVATTYNTLEVGLGEATFKMTLNGDSVFRVVGSRSYYMSSNSYPYNSYQFDNLVQWVTIVENVVLTQGQTCNMSVQVEEFANVNLSTFSTVGKGGLSKYSSTVQVVFVSN